MVYIAGPLTADVLLGTRNAIKEASVLADLGFIPLVPHLTTTWQMIEPRDYEYWMRLCFGWLNRCDALLRIPGESKGADAEVAYAEGHDIPVFYGRLNLLQWASNLPGSNPLGNMAGL